MTVWTPSESPRSRPRRSWLFDAAVALFALLTSATYVTSSDRLPTWVAATVIVAMCAPLAVRRLWPVPVFAWCMLVAAATGWWAMQVVWSSALVIALYTVAVLRPRAEALVAAGLLALGVVVSTLHVFPSDWYVSAASLLAVVVSATVLGLYIHTRRDLLEQLRQRALRVERDRDQEVALAAAGERARIAREMHDIVAHHLTVMVALSDGAATKASAAPEAAEVMRTVSATGRSALADTRRLLGVLRETGGDRPVDGDATLSPLPGITELDALVDRVRAAGLAVRYEVEGRPPVAATAVQLTVYRLVQEALTNVMKHAGPGARAAVRLRIGERSVRVDITDDGLGAPAGTRPGASGRGLVGMRERVEAFGGELRTGPGRDGGWVVSARLPLGEERRP